MSTSLWQTQVGGAVLGNPSHNTHAAFNAQHSTAAQLSQYLHPSSSHQQFPLCLTLPPPHPLCVCVHTHTGIVKAAPFLEMSEADFDAVINVNLKVR